MSVLLLGDFVLADNGVCQVDDVTVLVLLDHVQGLTPTHGNTQEARRGSSVSITPKVPAPYPLADSRMHNVGRRDARLVGNLLDTDLLLGIQQHAHDDLGPVGSITQQPEITERFLRTAVFLLDLAQLVREFDE